MIYSYEPFLNVAMKSVAETIYTLIVPISKTSLENFENEGKDIMFMFVFEIFQKLIVKSGIRAGIYCILCKTTLSL